MNVEALKERNKLRLIFRTFSALFKLFLVTRGDALRCASRLPLAIILRAFGHGIGARRFGFAALHAAHGCHIPRLWRWYRGDAFRCASRLPLAITLRAFGAGIGARRFAALHACPWLSYSAPLALL